MEKCSLSTWYQQSENFDWEGNNIVYKIKKDDKPWLLLIHGFPTASFDWWKVWDGLSEKFSLIAPDILGFGYSDKPKNYQYSIFKQADLIEDLLKHLNITSCHMLAHDYGDTIAQELIARFNEGQCFDIQSTCLLNGGIFPESHRPLLIQKLLMGPFGFIISSLLNQRKFEKNFGSIFGQNTRLSAAELDEYWQLVSHKNGHRIAHLLSRYRKERIVHRKRWVGALQNFTNKLGLINGPEDPISGQQMVDRFKEIVSNKNIWLLDGIGHYPQVEAREDFLKCYFDFLT